MTGGPLEAGLEACGRRLSARSARPLAVAFSGGGDSLALLLVARAFAEQTGRRLAALHVDHGLQAHSGVWAQEAATVAAGLGIPCRILHWEGPRPAAGVPAAARAARHRLLAAAAREAGAEVLLLGHTLDDQLENALMRGEGAPVGVLLEWSASPAWPEGRGLYGCRPLLGLRRGELRRWLAGQGLTWLDDPANDDERHPRARARHLLSQNETFEADIPALAQVAALARACGVTPWGGIEIPRAVLAAADPAQARRLLQAAVACASGAAALARPGRARGVLARLSGGGAFVGSLAGARIEAEADVVRLWREAGEAARGGLEPVDLKPGEPVVWDGRFEAVALEPGWGMEALRGQASRLSALEAARLRGIPASARPSLPVLRSGKGQGASIVLALPGQDAHIDTTKASVNVLAERRFPGAAGLVTMEDEIGMIACVAKFPPPSYVGTAARIHE